MVNIQEISPRKRVTGIRRTGIEFGFLGRKERRLFAENARVNQRGRAARGDDTTQEIEAKWQKRWEENRVFESEADPEKPKYYVLEMLPYPSRDAAYGAHAQLHDWGCGCARKADARDITCCTRWGGTRLDCLRRTPRSRITLIRGPGLTTTLRNFRGCCGALGFQLRLAAGNFDVRAGILPVEPVVLSADVGARNRIPEKEPGELVSEVLHGAGERAGGERGYCWRHEDTRWKRGRLSSGF